MKKIISIILVLALCMSFAGCNKPSYKSPKEITTYLTEKLDLDELTSVSGDKLSSYFGFKSDEVKAASFLISKNENSADMVAAFEYKDKNNRKKIIDNIAIYFTNAQSTLKNNLAAEYQKTLNRIICEYNGVVILVVCSDSNAAAQILKDYGAEEIK